MRITYWNYQYVHKNEECNDVLVLITLCNTQLNSGEVEVLSTTLPMQEVSNQMPESKQGIANTGF